MRTSPHTGVAIRTPMVSSEIEERIAPQAFPSVTTSLRPLAMTAELEPASFPKGNNPEAEISQALPDPFYPNMFV